MLKPFIRYYGGKYRAAPHYQPPQHSTIIEPFAGAAGYSMRYPERRVILVEKYPVLAEMWRYLVAVQERDILAIPEVEHVDALPDWIPAGGRTLVGFAMNAATTAPCRVLSAGRKKLRDMGRKNEGWSPAHRDRVAANLAHIRHWRIIEGDYTAAPNVAATWFIDPPYNNAAGRYYKHGPGAIDYTTLADWCRSRRGQTIVCENEGADWLPFQPFRRIKSMEGPRGKKHGAEAIWLSLSSPLSPANIPASGDAVR